MTYLTKAAIAEAAAQVDRQPSEAQIEAGKRRKVTTPKRGILSVPFG